MNRFGKFLLYSIGIFLIALLILTLQSSILGRWVLFLKPDLLLPLVVYLGFKRSLVEGSLFAFILGLWAEFYSGTPSGMYPLSYLSIALACYSARHLLSPDQYLTPMLASAAAFILLQLIMAILYSMTQRDVTFSFSYFLRYFLPMLMTTAILTPPLFSYCSSLDRLCERGAADDGAP